MVHRLPACRCTCSWTTGRPESPLALSDAEHTAGIDASPGDTVRILVYLENSAAEAGGDALAARNVRVRVVFQAAATADHEVGATVTGDNVLTRTRSEPVHGGNIHVRTTGPTVLEVVSGTSFACVRAPEARRLGLTGPSCGYNQFDGADQVIIPLPDGITDP